VIFRAQDRRFWRFRIKVADCREWGIYLSSGPGGLRSLSCVRLTVLLCSLYYWSLLVVNLSCRYGVLCTLVLNEVTLCPLIFTFVLIAIVYLLHSKDFQLQKVFSKKLCGSFGIGLFVSSDTCKGKTTYTRISPNPA